MLFPKAKYMYKIETIVHRLNFILNTKSCF